jgi:hypothetical protein
MYGCTAYNRPVTASPPSAARATKNRSRARTLVRTPLAWFFSATFGAVIAYRKYDASQRPITRPERQLQPKR